MSIEIIEAFLCNILQSATGSVNFHGALSNLSALSQPFLGGLDMVRRQLFTGGQSCLPLGSLVESCLWDAGRAGRTTKHGAAVAWYRSKWVRAYGLTKNMSNFEVLLASFSISNYIFLRLMKSMICPLMDPIGFSKLGYPWVSIFLIFKETTMETVEERTPRLVDVVDVDSVS